MNATRQPRFTEQYNVMLDTTHRSMLGQVAEDKGVPASQLVREWISNAYRMRFANEPRCVSGEQCKCPLAHAGQPARTASNEELLRSRSSGNGTPQAHDAA